MKRALGGVPLNVKRLALETRWPVLYINRALDGANPPRTMDELKAAVVAQMAAPPVIRKKSPISLRWNGYDPDSREQRLTNEAPKPVSSSIPPPRMSRRHSKDCA